MDVIFASVVVLFHDDPMGSRVTAAVQQAAKQQQGAVALSALSSEMRSNCAMEVCRVGIQEKLSGRN